MKKLWKKIKCIFAGISDDERAAKKLYDHNSWVTLMPRDVTSDPYTEYAMKPKLLPEAPVINPYILTYREKHQLLMEIERGVSLGYISTNDLFKYIDLDAPVFEEAFFDFMGAFKTPIITVHGREKCPSCGRYIKKNVATKCYTCGQRIFRDKKD